MAQKRSITIWSVLALVCILVGGAVTYFGGALYLVNWAQSGDQFPIGEFHRVTLQTGTELLYYQSRESVPRTNVPMLIRDPYGEMVRPQIPGESHEFSFPFTDVQGRVVWVLHVEDPGEYEFRISNTNVASDADVPPDDRIVFNKTPPTPEEALSVRNRFMLIAGTITGVLVLLFYVVHAMALSSR